MAPVGLRKLGASLFAPKRPEPSYPARPLVDDSGESNLPGLFLIGDVGGTPLVKLGLNQGVDTIDRLKAELGESAGDDRLDVVIVGAGCAGLGAAERAHAAGLKYVVLEGERFAMTVRNMYKGKLLFAEPEREPNKSRMWFEECTREQLLEAWARQIGELELNVKEHERVEDVQGKKDDFTVKTTRGEYRARRVILAIGKAGNPRKAGVPGEDAHPAKLFHSLSDPSEYRGKKIFVYGGGDVAAEAALALCDDNEVTMVTIDEALTYPKKRNVDALMAKQAEGKLTLHLASKLVSFDADSVTYRTADGESHTIDNDAVFEMIGAVLPLPFFRRIGVKIEGSWDVQRWLALAAVFVFVYSLYALKKFPSSEGYAPIEAWPFTLFIPVDGFVATLRTIFEITFLPFGWLFTDEAYAQIVATPWFHQGYLYSLAYTIIMIVFGYLAFVRWAGIARDATYQKWRYISLVGFQVAFFLIANVVAVQALSIQHAWRAWGLYQPWPLFFNTFHWWGDSDPRALLYAFVGAGLLGTFVVIPWMARNHGKRFCTWVCGCGGLAETLGDRWRHLAAEGPAQPSLGVPGTAVMVGAAAFLIAAVHRGHLRHPRANNVWWPTPTTTSWTSGSWR